MIATVLSFVADVYPAKRAHLEARLAALREQLRGPGQPPFGRVPALHFASIVVFDTPGYPPLLVFESNFDGGLDAYVAALLEAGAADLHRLLECCVGYSAAGPEDSKEITSFLQRCVKRPSAYHVGNVGRSVERIHSEHALREDVGRRIDARLATGPRPGSPEAAYTLIREQVDHAGSYGWIADPHQRQSLAERLLPWFRLISALLVAVLALLFSLWLSAGLILIAFAGLAALLRWHESRDVAQPPSALDPRHVQRLAEAEDHQLQNHLASITIVKAGLFRRTVLRVVLWAANLIARTSTKGNLSGIPSIHFAHWSLLDGGRRLLFLSNYDGGWEGYLDEFIDKASTGLTGIWSNTVGFPRTRFLVFGGARDGVAFKAFARSQQTREAIWYSAYPNMTVQQIDAGSTIREGLARPPGGAALSAWLRHW